MDKKYKSISDVAKILDLFNKNSGRLSVHTLRYWEKEFDQVKPKIFAGRRRYYDDKTIKTLKKIKYLLKEKGYTIKGVKNLLDNPDNTLDEINNISIKTERIKSKLLKISSIIKQLKK